jgi:thiol-disulfide isomerase/thioredoxin
MLDARPFMIPFKAMKRLLLLIVLFAPSLHAEVYNINQFSLESYRGRVVYLDFWASWCKPCQKSFPWMNQLVRQFPPERFSVVTINLDEQTEDMYDFLQRVEADFDVYHDASASLAKKFKLEGMPTSFLIDRDGKLHSRHVGFYESKKKQLEDEIRSLL